MTVDALRSEAAYELAHPRASVVAAIRSLGLTPGMRVLDAGCGAGAHLGLFAEAVSPGGVVTGLDLRPDRVALAAALHAARVATGSIRVVEGDLHAIPPGLCPFDRVWSSLVMHHEEQPAEALRTLARAVRPGGSVAVLDGDGGGSFPLTQWPPELELRLRAAALRAEEEGNRHLPYRFTGYLGRYLPRLLREAGLEDVRIFAFADVDRTPLAPARAANLRSWLLDSFGMRLRPFLAPCDWQRLEAHATERSPDDLLASADFFLARTWIFAIGTVPAARIAI